MSFPFYIARRYTMTLSKSTAVNIISVIAAAGIVISATALFVILSVFSGLKNFSLSFTNATDPDLKITTEIGKSFTVSPEQEEKIKGIKGIANYSHVVEERVLFYFDQKEHVAYLKGTDSIFTQVNPMEKQLLAGYWLTPQTSQCVVGMGTVDKLSIGLSDFGHRLEVYVPTTGKGPIDNPEKAFNKSALVPVAIYSINDDVDSKYVYCDLGLAQELLQYKPNQISALEIKLAPGAQEETVKQELLTLFNNKVVIKNRAQLNDSLYRMLNTENLVTYLICSLVVVLTLFCLAGALIMLILDKRENIKTLFCLGVDVKGLRKIFLYQGIFITALGTFTGLILGTIIIVLQQQFQLITITPTLPFPVEYNITNIVVVLLTLFTLGILASRIAARRVNSKLLENS
ncbi:membrane protein [Flavobacterium beibuense F44-8]|uniref:Membrane protein n=2 Tax=Flavobacterium beibuense TaxID=657326 RepID=A0A0A2LMV0_9FLAO|nr:membrane protein [Flavobacterium beibuense F44-8]